MWRMTLFTLFSLFWLQILNLPASLQNKNTRIGPFPRKRSVLENPDRERTNQSTRICLRLGLPYNNNLLLTECEGRTGEYWPEVVAVRTERSEVRTKMTEGQYSTVRLEQARLVSSLLYGTLSLIVKCTSGGLHLKMFVISIYLWNSGKFSIFSFSSDSFNVKNDIIHTFFRCFGCKFWICRLRYKTKIHGLDRFHGNGPYCKILTEKEPIRAQGFS